MFIFLDVYKRQFLPYMESLSVVPVGLSDHRDGLYPLEPFTPEDAREVIDIIHGYQEIFMEEYGTHFVHASDEWYILADAPLPEEENYDGYVQLENGVGMLRLQEREFHEALDEDIYENMSGAPEEREKNKHCTIATGKLAGPFLRELVADLNVHYPNIQVDVDVYKRQKRTLLRRPELLETAELTDNDKKTLKKLRKNLDFPE